MCTADWYATFSWLLLELRVFIVKTSFWQNLITEKISFNDDTLLIIVYQWLNVPHWPKLRIQINGRFAFSCCSKILLFIFWNWNSRECIQRMQIIRANYNSIFFWRDYSSSVITLSYCSSLTHITIPSSVTEICPNVFFGCSSLEKVTLQFNIKIKYLGINPKTTINHSFV